jgi:hypothetical protein
MSKERVFQRKSQPPASFEASMHRKLVIFVQRSRLAEKKSRF